MGRAVVGSSCRVGLVAQLPRRVPVVKGRCICGKWYSPCELRPQLSLELPVVPSRMSPQQATGGATWGGGPRVGAAAPGAAAPGVAAPGAAAPGPRVSALFSSPSPCCGCSSGGEGICHPPGADAAVGGGDLQHLPAPPPPPPSLCCRCSSGGGYGGGGCGQPASPAAPYAPCCPVRPVRPAALLPCAPHAPCSPVCPARPAALLPCAPRAPCCPLHAPCTTPPPPPPLLHPLLQVQQCSSGGGYGGGRCVASPAPPTPSPTAAAAAEGGGRGRLGGGSRRVASSASIPETELLQPSRPAAEPPSRPATAAEPPSRPAVGSLWLLPTRLGPFSARTVTSGASPAPPATADSTVRSQWATRDAAARLAVRRHLPTTERAHFSQYKSAQTLYDAVVARYSSTVTAALSRLFLPYLFPDLAAFPTVADLITHLPTSDTRYRAALPTEFCAKNHPPMYLTLYYIVTRLPDSLRLVRDHFLSVCPTSLTVDLLEERLLAAEQSIVAVGASRGDPCTPIFEGCSPSPLLPSVASAAAANLGGFEALVGLAGAVAVVVEAVEGVVVVVGVEAEVEVSAAAVAAVAVAAVAEGAEAEEVAEEAEAVVELWYAGRQRGGGAGHCTYVLRTGDRAGEQCGGLHSTQRYFSRLTDAWRHQFTDATEIPRWGDLSRAGVAIFDIDYDAILAAMYALSTSDEGDCYLCVPPDPGIEAAALGAGEAAALGASASAAPGAGESALSGTASAQVLHTFTLDSGASRSFFRDRTTLTPLSRPVAVSLADPSGGSVLASFSTVLPCPAAPSGTLSGLYLPSFSTNMVSGADLQDQGVDQFTPASQRLTHCMCARTGRHLATFTCRPGSSLYTLSTKSSSVPSSGQVAASSQMFAAASGSGPESAPCSCRLLSHQTLLWHHRLGHPSLPRLRGMASRVLVCGLPRSLPPLPPGPAPTCVPCVEGRQRAAPHSSEFPPTEAPLQTLHMDVWGPARVRGQGHERYFLLVVDDYSRYTTVFPLRSKGDVTESGGAEPGGAVPGGAEPGGAEPGGAGSARVTSRGTSSRRELLSPQELREWFARRWCRAAGAGGPPPVRGSAGACPGGTGAAGPRGAAASVGVGPAGGSAGASGDSGVAGSPGTRAPGAPAARAAGSVATGVGAVGAGIAAGAGAPGGAGAAGPSGVGTAGAEGAAGAGAAPGGTGAVPVGSGSAERPRPYFVPLLEQVLGLPPSPSPVPPLDCPQPVESQSPLQPVSSLPAPSPYAGPTGGLAERREPASRPASPVRATRMSHRAPRLRPPAVPGTHQMTLRPSTAPLRVPLPSPPASSLPFLADPTSDSLRAASLTVARLLSTVVTDPSFESTAASALVAELVDFAARCRLDYAASLVAESASCFAAALPHLVSTLIAPEGDPDARDIPTPRSYAEAIEGPYSSQWQSAMDAEMSSWKSTGTYVDEVPPPGANIVSGMWIFRVKRPPGSPPVFKARYVARGFSQRQGVDYFHTFSPTPKMTTLRVLLHVAAQRDYELHSLDFSTAFLQGSLHEEIWLRRPPGFTGSFPPGTQWSLHRPVYGLRQAPREWHDTLRTTLAALGFAPSTADPSLFLRTDTSLPPFYILVYVDDLVFATADTAGLAHVKSELQKRHTCTDLGELRSYLGLQITRDRAQRTITLTQSHMVQQVLQRFDFMYSSPQATPLSTRHSLSALPSDESVEPSGPYPELVGCLMYLMTCTRPDLAYPLSILARYVAPGRHRPEHMAAAKRVLRYLCSTSGLGLVLGGRHPVVLTADRDGVLNRGGSKSLGSGSVSWRSTRSSSVLGSSCEAEIYAGAMAAQELRWLTYLLADLGEPPRSPPVLYVDNKAMLALCREHRLEHRTKHIALRYFLARELQQRGQLRLAYVASEANTADIFTKALPPGDHQRFCTMLACFALLCLTGLVTPCSPPLCLWGLRTAFSQPVRSPPLRCLASARPACYTAMASLRVLAFDHEGRLIHFDTWLDDLQLYLLSDSRDNVSLFDHTSGAAPAPPATADSATRSQWLTCDAAARLAIRNHLSLAECAHFGQRRTAQALYDAVVARYSSPATAALGRLLRPYLFCELSAFATVEDLVSHLRTSDAHYRAALPAEFLAKNPPPMYITLYFIVTCVPDSLRAVRDHFLALDPTALTVDLLKQHLLAAETSVVAVGAARGTPHTPFFEGCSPSPLAPSYVSAAAADVPGAEDVGAASASAKRRSSKGKGARGGGDGSGAGGGGSSGGGGSDGSGGGSGCFGGGGGGSGGSGGSGSGGSGGGRTRAQRGGSEGGQRLQQQRQSETPSPQQLREWFAQRGASGGSGSCPYVIRTGDRAGQKCGKPHTQHRCFSRLDDAWRADFGDEAERPRWAELLRSGVAIFDLEYDAIIAAMYALSVSAEGDCYPCVPPDPGKAAAALGASKSVLPGTTPTEALHTFTLDSGTSRCFFRDSTTLTPLSAPLPVRLADPSGGPVLARSSTELPCPAVPSGSLSGLHLPSISTNLVSTAALQDAMVTTTTPGGQRVFISTCTRTGRHLATFTPQPLALCLFAGDLANTALDREGWRCVRVLGLGLSCLCSRYVRRQALCPRYSSVPFYHLFPYRSAPPPPPPLFLAPGPPPVDPLPPQGPAPSGVSQVDPLPGTAPVEVAVGSGAAPGAASRGAASGGAVSRGAELGGAESEGAGSGGAEPGSEEPGGAEPEGVELGGAEPTRVEPGGAESEGAESRGAEPRGISSSGGPAGALPPAGAGESAAGDTGARGAGVTAGAGGTGGATAAAGDPTEPGAAGAGGAGAVGAGAGGTGAGGAGVGGAGAVLGVPSSTGLTPPLLCLPPDQSQPPLQLASPLRAPPPYTKQTGGLTEHCEPASRPSSPVCTSCRVPRPRPPPVPSTHTMALRPSSVPLRVPPPPPPECSLPAVPDPESERARAVSPTVSRLLATFVTDPSFESTAVSALVAELVDFAAACCLDYATAIVAKSESAGPLSVEGECALSTHVLEDIQDDFECLAAAVPRFASMLLAPEGDPDAPDILTPRSYVEVITGPYSSQWQAAMDAEMVSWKSTGTYVDVVPPSRANIVDGMLIFRGSLHEEIWLRRPPAFTGSFPAGTQWSLRRLVYGLRHAPREWHDTLRTTLAALGFTPTADVLLFLRTDTSLPPFYVLVYVDNLVFTTADTEALTLVNSELQKRHTCTDLGELCSYLGLQITRDRALRTITLTQSHMVHQVLQHFGFQFSSPQPTSLFTGHSLLAPSLDESVEPSVPYPELVGCLMYMMTCTRPDLAYPLSLQAHYVARSRHRKVHWDAAKRVLRYLCSTLGMGLVLGGRGPILLIGHADASWVDDLATQRSSQGYTFSLGSDSVSWRSTRSSSVLSSNNKAMIALCQEHRLEHITKHIALRYFLAQDLQQRGQLRLAYVATRAKTADIFTKALPPAYFAFLDWSCDRLFFPTLPMGAVAAVLSPGPSSVGGCP
ncbi:unnamed protein product [Closterium sp. NIES-53]